jgi:hypothetical protein
LLIASYLALGAAEKKQHLAAQAYTMRFSNGRHPSVNVIVIWLLTNEKICNHDNYKTYF